MPPFVAYHGVTSTEQGYALSHKMAKFFIVHGVGSFQEQAVLEDVGRLAAAYGIDAGDVHAFNWDRRVNRVFGARSFNIGVLSEISAGALNAANLGFVSGHVYAGVPRWFLATLNGYVLIVQMCSVLWLPALIASIFSHTVRSVVSCILAGYLALMLLASVLSRRRWEALRAGFPSLSYSRTMGMNFSCPVLSYTSLEMSCDSVPTPPFRSSAFTW